MGRPFILFSFSDTVEAAKETSQQQAMTKKLSE
jgi:hypothetical protein